MSGEIVQAVSTSSLQVGLHRVLEQCLDLLAVVVSTTEGLELTSVVNDNLADKSDPDGEITCHVGGDLSSVFAFAAEQCEKGKII